MSSRSSPSMWRGDRSRPGSRERRLTQLEQILDVAIQFAWGLHAAHELGLVHQDVKPGNVLMSPEGVAKVSDFGLARARAAAGERDATGVVRASS